MPELEIFLLGRFRVVVDGVAVEDQRWSRKKARVAVKLLALVPGRRMHREQLIDILWPDADSELALNNLHKVIHAARRALEPELAQGGASRFLLTQELQVSLAGANTCIDVDEFERLAARALENGNTRTLEEALSRYTGDLLEEDLYEDWASVARERLRLTHQRILERLALNYEAAEDERTVEAFNRLLKVSPVCEDAHRRLMKVYAARGQRHLALNQYRLCCEALKQELDATPEPATVQLYESIIAGEGVASERMAAVAPRPESQPATNTPKVEKSHSRKWIPLTVAAALVLAALAALGSRFLTTSSVRPPLTSLAILPLKVRGESEQLAYISEGVTDGLINSTSRLPGMKVMARATVYAYKGRADPREVGRELKVAAVLNGRVEQLDDRVTVGVELVDVGDGSRLWARQYTMPQKEITSLQRLLDSELTVALRSNLSPSERERQRRTATGDFEAYRLYLTGRHFWNQRTPEGFRKSIECYRQAIARDPDYALAYAGLADSYGLMGFQYGLPRDFFPQARDAATKAIQLDQSLAEAQTSLAMVSALYDWNWAAAEAQFRRAIEMNPGYATAHHWFGVHLCAMGRFEEARQELETALNLDPLSPIVNLNYGYPAMYQNRLEEAMSTFDRVVALDPAFPPAHEDRMTVFELLGKKSEARKEAVLWLRFAGPPGLADQLDRASADPGAYRAVLREWLEAISRGEKEYVTPMLPAKLAIRAGDPEKGFVWLDRAFEQRSPQLVYLAVDPSYDSVHADSRFKRLLGRIGLTAR